ncbi:MAG: AAA-like domain-containing protein [Chloroflexota bacterium]
MRDFNIFGPVYPNKHYYLDRQEVKQQLHSKIEKGRYFTLNAARQMGKTTFLKDLINEHAKHGTYFAILLDFQALAYLEKSEFYENMGLMIERWRKHYEPSAPAASNMRNHGDFLEWLRRTSTTLGKQGILIIDEFEAVSPDLFTPLLTQFRSMYLARENPYEYALQSIILTGVHTIASLLEGTQSPFNIADQLTIPYFSFEESKTLLEQHTTEIGQRFDKETIQEIYDQSQGHPFLVNRLGKMLTEEIVPMPNTIEPTTEAVEQYTVTATHFERAMSRLLNEDNTHFNTVTSKSKPHRTFLLPMLFYNQFKTNFREEVTSELLMFGVLRVIEDEDGFQSARIANPIYQKIPSTK